MNIGLKRLDRMVASIPFTRCLCYKPERFRIISLSPYTSKVKIVTQTFHRLHVWIEESKQKNIWITIFKTLKNHFFHRCLKELCPALIQMATSKILIQEWLSELMINSWENWKNTASTQTLQTELSGNERLNYQEWFHKFNQYFSMFYNVL